MPEPRLCGLDICGEPMVQVVGERDYAFARRKYHGEACRAEARARAHRKPADEQTCGCAGCDVVFLLEKKRSRASRAKYCTHACATGACGHRARESKVCGCGCGETFERPRKLDGERWAARQYKDAEHRRQAWANGRPGAARVGRRTEPKPVPSRDRAPKPKPKPPPVVVEAPTWRPPPPELRRVERQAPRPSFGLSRRGA